MRLDDEISPIGKDGLPLEPIPCHIGQGTTQAVLDNGVMVMSEELNALMEPTNYATTGRQWLWRGVRYVSPEPPVVRRRHGKDHHYTVKMVRA